MKTFSLGLLAGVILGAPLGLLLARRPAPPPPPPSPSADARLDSAKTEITRLSARVAELETAAPPAPPPPPAAATAARPALAERFGALLEKGFAGLGAAEMRELLEEVKARGAEGVAFLARRLREGESSQERFLAAAALEGAKDPEAVAALAEALRSDPDDLVRRMASHAIASLGGGGAEAPLRAAMSSDKDWGVRVNSAYGLAKLGKDDGLRLLEESYVSRETPAEYRLAVLGGLADVAAPSSAPLFRRILGDTKDAAYLLMAVGALAKMKDVGSRAELERLAAAGDLPPSVREAARKAADELGK
jgi:HEAT repeat protein